MCRTGGVPVGSVIEIGVWVFARAGKPGRRGLPRAKGFALGCRKNLGCLMALFVRVPACGRVSPAGQAGLPLFHMVQLVALATLVMPVLARVATATTAGIAL